MSFPTNPLANPQSIISGPNYRFTILTNRLIRYEWAPDNHFEDRASTFAINRNFPVPEFRVINGDSDDETNGEGDSLEIITDHFHLTYDKKRFSPAGLVVHFNSNHTDWGAPWRYGVSEKLNLGGTARTLDECDGRRDMGDGVMSKAGHAALDDSTSMLFDGEFVAGRGPGGGEGGERVDGYLFCYGRDYKAGIKAFYGVSGKQPVLPRYALGNWWSRYYAYHQDEYVELMDKFRGHDIPMSVAVVDMDWHLVSDVPHAGWTGYTWNRKLFPEPERFRRDLHGRNLKITLNDHPHNGVHSHEDVYEEMARALGRSTSDKRPILFDPADARFMKAYFEVLHRSLEKVACDFWWIDWQQGPYSKTPGLDPLWVLNHFHYLDHGRDSTELDNGRESHPLIFSRYAGPGSHRYPVGFSGDTVVTWDSLAFQPEFTATASNIGYGWWSHDIGGHMFGSRDDELVTRWVQLGVFSPIFRLHSSLSRWMSKEPWLYRLECSKVISEFMRLRHRLVPFLYTRNVICSVNDEPLVQPMYWAFPDNDQAYSVPNQYMFGSELLVAPIVQPRDKRTNLGSVKAWLPSRSRYVDFFTGTVYDGNRQVVFHRRLEEFPVLAREGAIIVLDADSVPQNGCLNPTEFEVVVVIGRDAQACVLEDVGDDDAPAPENRVGGMEQQRKATISYDQAEGRVTAELINRPYRFRFLSVTSIPSELKVHSNGIDRTSEAKVNLEEDCQLPGLTVECPFIPVNGHSITIELGPNPQLSVIDPTCRLEQQIMDYQTAFEVKDQLWEVVKNREGTANTALGTLMSLGYDKGIVGPVAELLLADSRLRYNS
ncbi:glycosyl hydrolases family 31-domain-containing protein [Aspergillus cavernicola]|uniref:alpha-glucosidase n=1 Tax=Aspergillus cavernicola TaxID=176166 RepID=A0ABR4HFP9_9EURO